MRKGNVNCSLEKKKSLHFIANQNKERQGTSWTAGVRFLAVQRQFFSTPSSPAQSPT
jgi:hypothetical protein